MKVSFTQAARAKAETAKKPKTLILYTSLGDLVTSVQHNGPYPREYKMPVRPTSIGYPTSPQALALRQVRSFQFHYVRGDDCGIYIERAR